jgi:hypothetical protein
MKGSYTLPLVWRSLTSCLGRESDCELSATGLRADLYSAVGVQRNLGDSCQRGRLCVFSATGSRGDSATNAAKCDLLGAGTGYFSCNNDLLAEDAVRCEPLSAEFPANREKFSEFRLKTPCQTGTRRISVEFCVSYATAALENLHEEQGIIQSVLGNLVPC